MLRLFKQYYPIRNIFFVIGEGLVIYFSVFFANWIISKDLSDPWLTPKILLITLVCQICLYYNDLYDLQVTDTFTELGIRLLQALGASAIILAGIYFLFPEVIIRRGVFVVSIGFVIVFIVSWRILYTLILNRELFDQRIILLGSGELAKDILKEIEDRRDCGYSVAAVAMEHNDPPDIRCKKVDRFISKKEHRKLCRISKTLNIKKIVVALQERRGAFPAKELLQCRVEGIEVLEGNSFYEMLTGKLIVEHINPAWLIFSEGFRKSALQRFFKRTTDLTLSLILLILLLPIIISIAIIIKLDRKEPESGIGDKFRWFRSVCAKEKVEPQIRLQAMMADYCGSPPEKSAPALWNRFARRCSQEGVSVPSKIHDLMMAYLYSQEPESKKRPVFFAQERMGKDGKIYKIYKFRSMIVNAERISGPVWAGEDDKRITRIGNFIRKWRIDEIPQLWNILKGEMSFVGPRPEREHFVRQLELSIPYYRERLSVKPGLTGWAQVSYGYGASEDDAKEKLNYDLFYIKNMSIWMDILIVLRTIKIVIFGKGR